MQCSIWAALPEPHRSHVDRIGAIALVTDDTFAILVDRGVGPIVVEFMSYGCPSCQEMEPVLPEISLMLQSEVRIFRVDIGIEETLAASLDFAVIDTSTLRALC